MAPDAFYPRTPAAAGTLPPRVDTLPFSAAGTRGQTRGAPDSLLSLWCGRNTCIIQEAASLACPNPRGGLCDRGSIRLPCRRAVA